MEGSAPGPLFHTYVEPGNMSGRSSSRRDNKRLWDKEDQAAINLIWGEIDAKEAEKTKANEGKEEADEAALSTKEDKELETRSTNPNVTMEDKIAQLLFLIMKQMDRQITKQTKVVNELRKDANKPTGGDDNEKEKRESAKSSMDIESQKLQRWTTRRSQFFDLLKNIIGKYDETAKGIIQKIDR